MAYGGVTAGGIDYVAGMGLWIYGEVLTATRLKYGEITQREVLGDSRSGEYHGS